MEHPIEEPLDNAMFLARHFYRGDPNAVTVIALYDLGITPKNDGYTYLKHAIAMRYENPMRPLMDDIYIAISVIFGGIGDKHRVDQAIRRSIADAWKTFGSECWRRYFPWRLKRMIKSPSNGDFIANMVWFIELWQECRKEVEYEDR